jgi:hypothetical protein
MNFLVGYFVILFVGSASFIAALAAIERSKRSHVIVDHRHPDTRGLISRSHRSDNPGVGDEGNVCMVCELAVSEDDSYIVIGRSGEEPERVHEACMGSIRLTV